MENTLVVARKGGARRCLCLQKGSMRGPCDGSAVNLDCSGGYVSINILEKYVELNMGACTCKTDGIRKRSADCTNADFLAVILYYTYAGYCQQRKSVKGVQGVSVLFLTTACEPTIILK